MTRGCIQAPILLEYLSTPYFLLRNQGGVMMDNIWISSKMEYIPEIELLIKIKNLLIEGRLQESLEKFLGDQYGKWSSFDDLFPKKVARVPRYQCVRFCFERARQNRGIACG